MPSAEASHWWSPEAITTAPRLLTFDPDVTVQRARWRVGVVGGTVALSVVVAGIVVTSAAGAVVKWRSSRRRSSAPAFQIAYSSESARAVAEAAMMFVSLPIVDHSRVPSAESMITRVRAAVAASPSRIRTL